MLNYFISFLLRLRHKPIPGYPATLSTRQGDALDSLYFALTNNTSDSSLFDLIHSFVFLLLSESTTETAVDQWRCPFLRFMIAYHLVDTQGNFINPIRIPPTISKLQWPFRAICARHIHIHKEEYAGDAFRSAQTHSPPSTY